MVLNTTFNISLPHTHSQDKMNQAPLNPSTGNSGNMMQRQLHKKLFQQKSFASPTDNLMSPCSAKLRAHKNKYISM